MTILTGLGNISAEIIADSVDQSGNRITTFVLEYPRFIHAEFMTHRMVSKNSASSRAIPVEKMIELIKSKTAMPIHWGKNQPGMQANEECDMGFNLSWGNNLPGGETFFPQNSRVEMWKESRDWAIMFANAFHKAGYHKQIVNRLLEPYQMMRVVATATEWDNFFSLRNHPDAQPEIHELARVMLETINNSSPKFLDDGDWHTPFYQAGFWLQGSETPLEQALRISSSCCAQVSFRKADDSLEKAEAIYKRLVESKPVHASPFEHQARAVTQPFFAQTWVDGSTHMDSTGQIWSGNFKSWIQHRQLIKDHVCNVYDGIIRPK